MTKLLETALLKPLYKMRDAAIVLLNQEHHSRFAVSSVFIELPIISVNSRSLQS